MLALTAAAAALRLVRLGAIPYGVHSDEAQVGTDVHRILSEGWIGVYTRAALGQPTGHAYLTTPSIWLLGDTAFALRLPLALVAVAAIPLLYLLVRVSFRRTEAVFAAALLAVSYWHLYYSRVAHWSISYGTLLLGVLVCIMLGLRRGGWGWYAAGGVLLGLGIYTYNIDPIAVVATAAFVAIISVRVVLAARRRSPPADRASSLPPARAQAPVSEATASAATRAPDIRHPTSEIAPDDTAHGSSRSAAAGTTTGHTRAAADIQQPPSNTGPENVGLTTQHASPRRWWTGMAILWLAAFIVALPFLNYVRNPDAYYWSHLTNYQEVRITRTPQYAAADTWGRIKLIAGEAKYFASAYAWAKRPDIVDANGSVRPMFDPLTLILLAAGLAFVWRYRREPMVIAAVCGLVILPLPAVLQKGSIMREPVGAAPYAMFVAALPLAALWRAGLRRRDWLRYAPAVGAVAVVAVVASLTIHDYFRTMRKDPFVREIFFSQETSASTYLRSLPSGTYVYFYSERAPFALETRQYLAPDVRGEDRSKEFGGSVSVPETPRRPSVFILMGPYEALLPEIEKLYPGGERRTITRDGKFEFTAYRLR